MCGYFLLISAEFVLYFASCMKFSITRSPFCNREKQKLLTPTFKPDFVF